MIALEHTQSAHRAMSHGISAQNTKEACVSSGIGIQLCALGLLWIDLRGYLGDSAAGLFHLHRLLLAVLSSQNVHFPVCQHQAMFIVACFEILFLLQLYPILVKHAMSVIFFLQATECLCFVDDKLLPRDFKIAACTCPLEVSSLITIRFLFECI